MKKMLILPAVALIAASGCQCGSLGLFGRRDVVGRPVIDACEPACDPCSEGEGPILGGDTFLAPPTIITPGPIIQ